MKIKFLLILTLGFLIISCQKVIDLSNNLKEEKISVEDLKTLKINNSYSISVPSYMSELTSLNDEASFQYANIFKDVYTIVIDEDKEKFINVFTELEMYDSIKTPLENYTNFQLKSFQESIEDLHYDKLTTNKPKLNQYQFNGKVDGLHISYLIGFYEGEKDMYLLMSWTQKDKFKKYKNTFKIIHNSFKILY